MDETDFDRENWPFFGWCRRCFSPISVPPQCKNLPARQLTTSPKMPSCNNIASWLLSPLQNSIFFRHKTDITKSAWTNPWIDVSTAKSLGLDINLLGKSFMYAKKNNGPKLDSWGTPALMGDYLDDWPFRTSLCCLFLRNEFIIP